jgi:hypothetical protein
VGRRRCPNCGKRAPDGVVCCRNCGHSIPLGPPKQVRVLPVEAASEELDAERNADLDEEDGPPDLGATTARNRPSPDPSAIDADIDDPELLARAEEEVRRLPLRLPFAEPVKDPNADKAVEPRQVGWECPTCGGQAQRGWKTCPWCRSPLPAYVWKPEGQDAED